MSNILDIWDDPPVEVRPCISVSALVPAVHTIPWPSQPERGAAAAAPTSCWPSVANASGGTTTLVQYSGSAATVNIHLHCVVLDGEYRCGADGVRAHGGDGLSGRCRWPRK